MRESDLLKDFLPSSSCSVKQPSVYTYLITDFGIPFDILSVTRLVLPISFIHSAELKVVIAHYAYATFAFHLFTFKCLKHQ